MPLSSDPAPILLESGPCLVFCKPAGLLTQAPPGIDSLEARIKAWIKQRDAKPGGVYLGVPHRLDRPVSGAIVFARHVRAARRLSEQFEDRLVRKTYWACVAGTPEPASGTWRDQLRKVPGEPRAEVVGADHPEGRPAVLHYRTLGQTAAGAWLEIELETGRNHQVRVQCASHGFPVLGDALYGSSHWFGREFVDERLRPIALHARSLAFNHPMTREPVSIVAPVFAAWRALELPLGEADYLAAAPGN
ncbi:MAG TPA: RNA pseudouridine synthase [Pirellulales bacterium]|jgi:RluA family pseudouridine synthase|nr:RNA pseudouridine synthase [Pirellulales bacterium]